MHYNKIPEIVRRKRKYHFITESKWLIVFIGKSGADSVVMMMVG